jgi:CBS domain-containing protein
MSERRTSDEDTGAPIVLPVNFVVVSDAVLVRTGAGELLAAAVHRQPIAFEVDGWDVLSRTGWSVLLTGLAEEVTRPSELAEVERFRLQPWAPGLKGHVVRLRPDAVTGRRIPQLAASAGDVPTSLLTGPDTPVGALALRPLAHVDATASIIEAIAVLHVSESPIGELADGRRELVSLAGLVRAIGVGHSPDTPARHAAEHDLLVVAPQLSILEALHAMSARNLGSALVRPATQRVAGVMTVADVMPSLLWFFDPAVAALLQRG